jgi:hypothetical protein
VTEVKTRATSITHEQALLRRQFLKGLKPKLPPLVSPVKKATRVETRASHQQGAQGALW